MINNNDIQKLTKAKQLRDQYKSFLIEQINNKVLPPYLENWGNRILQLEYLIIDLRTNN